MQPDASSKSEAKTTNVMVVLLVDDQPFIGEFIRLMLAKEPDIKLHYCKEAGAAVKMAQELRPTIILQDFIMADVDALVMLERYRSTPETRATPVIVLTGREDPVCIQNALKAGANDYLIKMPSRSDLVACLRKHSTLAA